MNSSFVGDGGVRARDGGGNLHQLSLCCNDEVQVPEAHVRAWDPADAMTSHPRPDVGPSVFLDH